jgi:hypothetical protein
MVADDGHRYEFQGVPVEFPYDAYDVQVCPPGRPIASWFWLSSVDRGQRTPRSENFPCVQKQYMETVIKALQQVCW